MPHRHCWCLQAREIAPAIIFIDEIDAIGRTRGGSQGNNERDQTLNMLLTELDGFEEDTGVIIMGATNRKDVLDPALIRPGRFDRIILVGRPDYDGRIDILKVGLTCSGSKQNHVLAKLGPFDGRQQGNRLSWLMLP